ncbi:tetratricopeptide repeat protein [Sphingomonas sp.]|uniref:tetratricopeptide repeat protein n=1 Tax=Sphingomonas sp. TaxID=28214 RepID=UPI001EBC5B97|nr:tetratricopeptide repeat protein [Sphingomonas sp.]MBX3595519.1 tetratricopeptide repeat protein [Sphingomonas sp.]
MRAIAIGCVLGTAGTAVAQTSTRIPVPPEGEAAFAKRDYGAAAQAIIPVFEKCVQDQPQGDACADLAAASAVLVATAGNAKVENIILRALDYVDTHVGRDSTDALGILGALTSYYDRLLDMKKFEPVAERRLALARKLSGPTSRTAVIAAVSLCIAQWNLGKGQAAVDMLTPLMGKLPETTRDEQVLAGRVYDCAGTAYYTMDKHREAEAPFRKAVALYEKAAGEADELTLGAMASLANTLRRLGREGEARAVAVRVSGLAKSGSPALKRVDWAGAAAADPVEAARVELATTEKTYGAKSPLTDMAAAHYGIALIDAGKLTEAQPYLARLEAAAANPANPASVRIKLMLGHITLLITQDQGRFDRAVPIIERLVALAKQSGAGSEKMLIDFQMYAGTSLLLSGKAARAYPFLSDAGDRLLARIASYRDFDAAAQKETREYAPIFKFKVTTAWVLARQR